jgi:hypothetical protein
MVRYAAKADITFEEKATGRTWRLDRLTRPNQSDRSLLSEFETRIFLRGTRYRNFNKLTKFPKLHTRVRFPSPAPAFECGVSSFGSQTEQLPGLVPCRYGAVVFGTDCGGAFYQRSVGGGKSVFVNPHIVLHACAGVAAFCN